VATGKGEEVFLLLREPPSSVVPNHFRMGRKERKEKFSPPLRGGGGFQSRYRGTKTEKKGGGWETVILKNPGASSGTREYTRKREEKKGRKGRTLLESLLKEKDQTVQICRAVEGKIKGKRGKGRGETSNTLTREKEGE